MKKKTTNVSLTLKPGIIMFSLLLLVSNLAAQTGLTISGTIKSAANLQPVAGVSVLEKGTKNGITSDKSGNYTLKVSRNATLVFTSTGYKAREIAVGDGTGGFSY